MFVFVFENNVLVILSILFGIGVDFISVCISSNG